MESSIKKPQQPQQPDMGTSNKKKKDRENRNSVSHDVVHDWTQKNEIVTVSLLVGVGNDNRTVNVNTEENRLSVTLTDGRRFSTPLYQSVVPEGTSVNFKGPRCFIKLLKNDPTIDWPHLEVVKKAPSTEKIITNRAKSQSPSKSQSSPKSSSPAKNQSPAPNENNIVQDSKDKCIIDDKIMTVNNIKTNVIERDQENILIVYLYCKNINKENASVKFSEDTLTARFSTCDGRFLQQYPGSTEDTLFEWESSLKDKIIAEECKFKVTNASIEIKLKKQNMRKWGSLAPNELGVGNKVAKNTWIPAGKTEPPSLSNIPPAPAPPSPKENKKPMCLVSPVSKGMRVGPSSSGINSYSSFSDGGGSGGQVVQRGLTGLDNIGNTCFMNSVLQCLVNTRELREYFLDAALQNDLNKDNPLGMGGKLAVAFAILMKLLWSGTFRSHAPTKLKSMMSIKANQFSGFAQHDAQEFMVELLDGLHEDLNRIRQKPYIAEPPDLDGWSDHDAASESWRLHRMRNDSTIDDLFKGQFKSTLTCHQCNKVSVKFDEFCCLSVPIPKDQKMITVIFFWKDPYTKPKKFYIRIAADATVEELKRELCDRTSVSPMCMQVFEMFKSKIHKIFAKGATLGSVVPTDALMAFEVYNEHQVGEPVVEIAVVQRMMQPSPPSRCAYCSRNAVPGAKLRRCTKCYRAAYCDTNCQKNHWPSHRVQCKLAPEPVGCPFILSLPESHATYSRLTRIMEAYARYSVDIFQPPVSHNDSSHRGSTSSVDLSSEDSDHMEVDEGEVSSVVKGVNTMETEASDATMEGEEEETQSVACGAEGGSDGNGIAEGSIDDVTQETDTTQSADPSMPSLGDFGFPVAESQNPEEPPQLSSSPSVRAVQPQTSIESPAGTQLFVIRPVNSRAQTLGPPTGEVLEDKGDEPLDLGDKYYIAMDWKTNERLQVHCLVQDKEVDCETEGTQYVQRKQHTTLEACIQLFTEPENLSEGDCWRCPRCKKAVEATKQMSLWRLPNVLIIQLKRFSFKYVLYSDKIDKFVQYPLKGLDVSSFMSCEPDDGPAIYDLYGVINHMGRLLGGHYTAYARTVQKDDTQLSEIDWRHFDDSRVNFCSESRVVNEQAYLLLYRRRDTPFKINWIPSPSAFTASEEGADEGEVDEDQGTTDEVTPMSVSEASQPSDSSLEGEQHISSREEQLD